MSLAKSHAGGNTVVGQAPKPMIVALALKNGALLLISQVKITKQDIF